MGSKSQSPKLIQTIGNRDDLQITCTKGMYPHLPTEWRHPLVFDVGNNLKGGLDPSRYKECGVSMFASKLLVEEPQWVNLKGKKTANIVERKKETK